MNVTQGIKQNSSLIRKLLLAYFESEEAKSNSNIVEESVPVNYQNQANNQ
jgi:hypothetical protein